MLPNFLIIGVQKAATTWLTECLHEHPNIFIPEMKEIYFFSEYFEKGITWYASHFHNWSGQSMCGEGTPGYISHPDAPKRIHATLGKVKFIASLRHPVDRAYSAFWHHLSRRRIPVDTDFYTYFRQNDHFELYSRGNYFVHLSRYFQYFPRENFLIFLYEEMTKNRQKSITDCFSFLGIDSHFIPKHLDLKVNKANNISIFHNHILALQGIRERLPRTVRKSLAIARNYVIDWSWKKRTYTPLTTDIRQELLHYYMEDIKKLEDLLQRDFSIWYKDLSS